MNFLFKKIQLRKLNKTLNIKIQKKKHFFTVPFFYYLCLLIASILLIILPFLFPSINPNINHIIENFGFGIWGSTFVAILVDYGTTRKQSKADSFIFNMITQDLRHSINGLLLFRRHYNNMFEEKYRKLPYYIWITESATQTIESGYGNKELFLDIIINAFKPILDSALLLNEKCGILANNSYAPTNFINDLSDYIITTKSTFKEYENKGEFLLIGYGESLVKLINLFPNLRDTFIEEWDTSSDITMSEKETDNNN